jgi:uncharacterized protein (UPF0218 family)
MPRLILPPEARRDFAAPRGAICRGRDCGALLLGLSRRVACVGDVVAGYCLDALESSRVGRSELLIVVYDGKTRRSERVQPLSERLQRLSFNTWKTENPAGGISPGAASLLCRVARSRGFHAVEVTGEEDMLALVMLECMLERSLVAYGMPGRGMVIVAVTRLRRIDAWLRRLRLRPSLDDF